MIFCCHQTLQHGSVCQQTESPATQVHQLEARSGSDECPRLPGQLEESRGICIPTICINRQMSPEDKGVTEYGGADRPTWQNQPWFPILLEMLIEPPILLPWCRDMLSDSEEHLHPLVAQKQLRLAAWKISDNNMLQLGFQSKLQNCLLQDGARGPTQQMSLAGSGGVAGVKDGRLMQFQKGFNPS